MICALRSSLTGTSSRDDGVLAGFFFTPSVLVHCCVLVLRYIADLRYLSPSFNFLFAKSIHGTSILFLSVRDTFLSIGLAKK